jgi:hypothetical protein
MKAFLNKYFATILFAILFYFVTCFGQEQTKTDSSINKSITNYSNNIVDNGIYDEIYHAKVVDLVVIGEVVKLADLPGLSTELFHSEAIVKIDSVLKGKANFNTVILLRLSGPLTDKGISPNNSLDASFKVGENAIYFLLRSEKNTFLTSPFIQKGLYSLHRPPDKDDKSIYKTSFYSKKSLSELPDSVFWGSHVCRDVIVNDSVHYKWGTFDTKTVVKEIKTLLPSTIR